MLVNNLCFPGWPPGKVDSETVCEQDVFQGAPLGPITMAGAKGSGKWH